MSYVEEKGFVYFQVTVTENKNIFVLLTPLDDGDPDLFINYGLNSLPNQIKSDWSS